MATSQGRNAKPDIILMDVQMPIIDGYKCTHLLRHHVPYKSLVQDVPIVAMTASAIQGDREKCKKAGMDDYLAKPVTMSILESMLIRWGTSKRRIRQPCNSGGTASDCSEMSEHCDTASIPQIGIEDSAAPGADETPAGPATPRPLNTNGEPEASPFGSLTTAEMEPQVRRPEGEKEWSNMLQETKLIDAAGGPPSARRANSYHEQGPGEALTEENMNKLEIENEHNKQQQQQQESRPLHANSYV